MSRPRSRSPLYSRIPTLQGRRTDGFFNNQIHSSVQSDSWRNPEIVNKVESNAQWNKGSYQGEQHVDHWAKFIDAIEHAQKRGASPMNRYRIQDDEERPPQSPRRLPRERLPSPDRIRLGVEERYRMPSPGWNRNEGVDKELGSQHNHRDLRDRSYPRHPEGRRQDQMDYGYHNEEHGDQYHERGSYSERSSKSDYREHHPSTKRFTDLGLQDEFVEHHRGFSPRRAPVIVEHDHGIAKRNPRNLDPPKTSGHHPRSRDPPRQSETQRNREPYRERTNQGNHTRTLQDRHGGRPNGNPREETRKNYSSFERENPGRERPRQMDQSRMESYSRDSEGRREMVSRDMSDIDLRNRDRDSVNEWEEERPQRNHGRMMGQEENRLRAPYDRNPKPNFGPSPRMDFSGQETLKIKVDMSRTMGQEEVRPRAQYQRNPKTNAGPAPRMDFSEQETLKIKVDMSRPAAQTSYLGYSSDRQLSLDLVNVGRQRLDFLPMLEHSGTFRESAVHSGTFAQEIITLVHQVKENYFRGQGITLNARFANEQYYSLQDEFREEEEEKEEMGNVRPLMHRQHRMPSSETPDSRRQLMPDPGDLRYDLERRRQQRLEDVKITIAGGNFTQMTPGSDLYMRDEPEEVVENFRWSEQERELPRQWDGPHQRMPEPTRQNFNPRGNSNRIARPRGRRT